MVAVARTIDMGERKCRRCGSPNSPLFVERDRNIDVILFDCVCLDCRFSWSEVLTVAEFNKIAVEYGKELHESLMHV